jgi:uncharacterized protein involved in outer membrane biogenesis
MEDNSVSPALRASGRDFLGVGTLAPPKAAQLVVKVPPPPPGSTPGFLSGRNDSNDRPSISLTQFKSVPTDTNTKSSAVAFPHDQFFSSDQN